MSEQYAPQADKPREGGVYYPTGWIVAAFGEAEDARRAQQLFSENGFRDQDLVPMPAVRVAQEAQQNLASPGLIASLGASVQVRQRQLELARQGCDFLLIHAPEDGQHQAALSLLSRLPVRYAVKYRQLVIEDLIPLTSPGTADREHARAL